MSDPASPKAAAARARALTQECLALLDRGAGAAALDLFEQAIRLDSTYGESYVGRGCVAYNRKHTGGTRPNYQGRSNFMDTSITIC
jgi:hypothetical protein